MKSKKQDTQETSQNPLKTVSVDKMLNPENKEGVREKPNNSLCLKDVFRLLIQCPFLFFPSLLMTLQMDHPLCKQLRV